MGFDVRKGADISPGSDAPQRETHENVVLKPRVGAALRRINRYLPGDAIEQAAQQARSDPARGAPETAGGRSDG